MKYLGGKNRLGKYLSPFLMELYQHINHTQSKTKLRKLKGYVEPFCGSLGVLKQIAMFNHQNGITSTRNTSVASNMKIYAYDYHEDLIALWKEVQSNTFEYPISISEQEYNDAKLIPSPSAYKAFVGFGLSFGGRYFGAYAQKYLNGRTDNFCREMSNTLKKVAPYIHNVNFRCKDYRKLRHKGMFIYCDPPYAKTKYPIRYRRDIKKYDIFDNDTFWETVRKWSRDNFVVVSETTCPDDFVEIWRMTRYRSAAQSKKTRFLHKTESHAVEKLFVHSSLFHEIEDWLATQH